MTNTEVFKPLGERVLLKRLESNYEKGGILLPETHEGKQLQYLVIAKNDRVDGVEVGDTVIAVPDGGQKIKINGHGECEIIESRRIMGVLA